MRLRGVLVADDNLAHGELANAHLGPKAELPSRMSAFGRRPRRPQWPTCGAFDRPALDSGQRGPCTVDIALAREAVVDACGRRSRLKPVSSRASIDPAVQRYYAQQLMDREGATARDLRS